MIAGSAIYRLAALVSILLASAQAYADNAYLNPSRIYAGDVTELVLEYDNKIPSLYALDTAELELDFKLLETNSRIIRVNEAGEIYHRMQWRLRLQPRASGILTVPSIKIGERRSRALQLEVLPYDANMRAHQQVFIEVETVPAAPYPGQQVLLKTRLFFNTPIGDGRLVEPDADAAALFRSNDSRRYRIERDGGEFEVLEKITALVAESAKPLRLEAASWDGILPTRNHALGRPRSIYRQSERPEIELREAPPGYGGDHWLPARELILSRQWQRPAQPLAAGATVDFTLHITAIGVPAESLPDRLLALDRDEIKIYPDRARRSNEFDGSELIGRLEQRYVVILPQAGSITVPGLDLTWWDVDADRETSVRLEAELIEVAAAPAADMLTPGFDSGGANEILIGPRYLLAAVLLAAGGFLFWWLPRSAALARARRGLADRRRQRQLRMNLERACRAGDPAAARRLLLEWAGLNWRGRSICGLHQIEHRVNDPALGAELRRLDAALYSPRQGQWRGDRLWHLLQQLRRTRPTGSRREFQALPGLYPG